jgi:uncharacterized protein (TIRG00374 family)
MRLVGVGLLILLLWQLDMTTTIVALRGANPYLVAVAVLLNLPMVLCKSIRWQALLASQQIGYGIRSAYLAYFGSIYIGFLTPGRLGEFVKINHLRHDCQVSTGQALSSVLADRLFDLSTLLIVGGMALLTLGSARTELAALAGMLLVLVLPLLLFLNDQTFERIKRLGSNSNLLSQRVFADQGLLMELRRGLLQLNLLWLVAAIGLTILAYAIFFGQCYLLALALNMSVSFLTASYAVALGNLITLLPISIAGVGTRDAVIIAYLAPANISAPIALSFSLLVFLTFYLGGGLIGAVAWWLKPAPLARSAIKTGD